MAVAVEQSRGALIHALLSHDFVVIFPIHPTTVARFREAFKFSGVKSDPLDTGQILEILTKHLNLLQPLRPDTEQTRLLWAGWSRTGAKPSSCEPATSRGSRPRSRNTFPRRWRS